MTTPQIQRRWGGIARRDRLVVGDGATTSDVTAGLRLVRRDRDVGEPGSRRLVRNPETTVSDLIRQLRDAAADDRTPDTLEGDQ